LKITSPSLSGFEFKAGDTFSIGSGDEKISPTSTKVEKGKSGKESWVTLEGTFEKVTLKPKIYPMSLTVSGNTETFSDAIEIYQPVKLIIANQYYQPDKVADEAPFNDVILGGAQALVRQLASDEYRTLLVKMHSPQKADGNASWSTLGDYLTKAADKGGGGVKPGTITQVYSLGHGARPLVGGFGSSMLTIEGADTVFINSERDLENKTRSEESFIANWSDKIAKHQNSEFTIYHCFCGMNGADVAQKEGEISKSAVARLRAALTTSSQSFPRFHVRGWKGIVYFGVEIEADGTKVYAVPAPPADGMVYDND